MRLKINLESVTTKKQEEESKIVLVQYLQKKNILF